MNEFKVGDKVRLKVTSPWAEHKEAYLKNSNPLDTDGFITEILPSDPDDLVVNVTWSTFYESGTAVTNSYTFEDLEVVES